MEESIIYNGFEQFLGKINTYKVEQLTGGLSNNFPCVCLVNDKNYVVRIFRGPLKTRNIKLFINHLVTQQGIAPKIYHHGSHDDFSFIIMDFIEGHTLSFEQASHYRVFDLIAQKLKLIAQIDTTIETIYKENFFNENMRHYNNIKKKNFIGFDVILEEIKDKIEYIYEKLNYYNKPLVMGHNDFYPRNIFFARDDIIIIDWDTMGLNYEFGDLASYSIFFCLNEKDDSYLLTQYLQCVPTIQNEHYFKTVKLMVRACLALNFFAMVESISEPLFIGSVKNFKYYATIFAQNSKADSSQFFYECGMSQLQEFYKEYKDYFNLNKH